MAKKRSRKSSWSSREAAEAAASQLRRAYSSGPVTASPEVYQKRSGNWGIRMNWSKANPSRSLPVGKKVRVYAKRLKNGQIQLYR